MSWLCAWCATNGKYPVEEAYRPDDEEPVITAEGEMICQSCANNYRKGREQQRKEQEKHHNAV